MGATESRQPYWVVALVGLRRFALGVLHLVGPSTVKGNNSFFARDFNNVMSCMLAPFSHEISTV